MHQGIGIICLVAGGRLIVWEHNLAQSLSGQFSRIFTGSPGDKSMWLYRGGGALCALGVFQIFAGKQ